NVALARGLHLKALVLDAILIDDLHSVLDLKLATHFCLRWMGHHSRVRSWPLNPAPHRLLPAQTAGSGAVRNKGSRVGAGQRLEFRSLFLGERPRLSRGDFKLASKGGLARSTGGARIGTRAASVVEC